jgi:NTP pyrophosphatase (non-canonical NTP hydrolase)
LATYTVPLDFPRESSMNDEQTTVRELRETVEQFVRERNWQQFHTPKNISMALAVEAAELLEHFQWLTMEESWEIVQDPDKLLGVREELADVVCYALAMANRLELDLSTAIEKKMEKNRLKYPAP